MLNEKNKKIYIITIVSLIVGISIGFGASKLLESNEIFSTTEIRNSNFRYISPLLECQTNENRYEPNLKDIENELNKSITSFMSENKNRHVSVYVRDLKNGPWFGINEDERFSPASLFKMPIMITYFKKAETQPDLLQKKVPYVETDIAIQNIKPSSTLITGKSYSINELIEKMIQQSDNNALISVSNEPSVKQKDIEKMFEDIGHPDITFDTNTTLSVRQYSSLFRILYNSSYLNDFYSEKALSTLAESDYKNGIRKPLPKNIKVSNKFGERHFKDTNLYQLHDCGIVYFPNRPYLICIMTRGESFESLTGEIQEISNIVFKGYKEKYKLN